MKNTSLLLFVFLFLVKISFSQSFSWVKTGGGTYADAGFGVTVDGQHNVIVTGMYFGNGIFAPTTFSPYGIQDAFLAKYDSTGTLLWAKNFGGAEQDWGYAVAADATGNIFVTGTYSTYSMHFTATDSLAISAAGALNTFVAKYDPNGNFLWARRGASGNARASSLATDASGNVIAGGFFSGSIDFSGTPLSGGAANLFLVKYSSSGAVTWAKAGVSSSNCATYALKCDAAGNIYAAGKISQNVTFGASTYLFNGGDDLFAAKFDMNGNVQWFNAEGKAVLASTTSNNFDCGNGIDVDNSGNVYVAGSLLDTAISATPYQSMALIKYNSSGTQQWIRKYGNNEVDGCKGLSLDASGNPYVIGNYEGALTIGTVVLPSAPDADMFMAKFDASGNCIGAITINSSFANGDDSGNGIWVDKTSASVYSTGSMRNLLNFGSIPVTADNGEVFVSKMNSGSLNSIAESSSIQYKLYPNPSAGKIFVQLAKEGEYVSEIYNATGQMMQSRVITGSFSEIDLSGSPSGLYFISISNEKGERAVRKLMRK